MPRIRASRSPWRNAAFWRAFTSIQLSPPSVISREEIDQMVTIVDESLRVAAREFDFTGRPPPSLGPDPGFRRTRASTSRIIT
jgi:hypothetical protein